METIALLLGLGRNWTNIRGTRVLELLQSRMQRNDYDDEDSVDEYMTVNQEVKSTSTVANTTILDQSDISLHTKLACGITTNNDLALPSVAPLILKREIGPNFTHGQKCNMNGNFLPNIPKRIAKYNNKPFCGTFSKDGNYLITTTHDRAINLYTYKHGKYTHYQRFPVTAVGWSILDTAFSPDGSHFVYSSWSDYLYMHSIHGDPSHREPLLLGAEHPMFCVYSVRFSRDGREVFCGANDGCLYIYDRGSQQCTKVQGHDCDVNAVAFADDSAQILYSAGDDEVCKVWDRRSLREDNPQPVGALVGHMGGITYIDPRGDGRHVITNSKDQTIKLWDARVFSSKEAQDETQERLTLSSNSWDYRWQNVPKKFLYPRKPLNGDTSLMTYRGHIVVQTLIRCHFSPAFTTGQRYIYTGCGTGHVIIYDMLTGKIAKSLKGHKTVVRDVSWHPHHQEIVSTSWDGEILSWQYRHPNKSNSKSSSASDSSDSDEEKTPARRTRSQTSRRSAHRTSRS